MSKKYYEKIDILRGFAILLVVLGHALDPANILTDSVAWCNYTYIFIYSFHMPLFFAISGFCMFNVDNYAQFIKKKVRYILVPYLVFNIIIISLRIVLPQFSLVSNSIKDCIVSMLVYGGEIWFLYVLFEIFLGITKAGNRHVRMLLTEASQCYARGQIGFKSKELKSRQAGNSPQVIAYADKANERLRRRYYKMVLGKSKKHNVAKTAIARELACFMWGMMTDRIA